MKLDSSISKLIQTIVILPKYVFVNNSKYDLILVQPGVNHMQKVSVGSRIPIIWRQANNRMIAFCPLVNDLDIQ